MLAGVPPEITKVLLQSGLKQPVDILLPDLGVSHGESQVAVEFPLYHHLFWGEGKHDPKPLRLWGSSRRVESAVELLDLTLFGPREAQMREWGMTADLARKLYLETNWFQVKDKAGKPIAINKLATGHVIGDQEVDLGWLRIRRLRTNVFRLTPEKGEPCDLDLTPATEQAPPYPVAPDLIPTSLVKLGVEVLGGSTGFSTTQASSGMAICYNGQYLLIDAIPYLNHHLRARGISPNQVQTLFLSHIHDDHCNVLPLLQYNRKIKVLTTPLIFNMLLRKLSLVIDRTEESLRHYFHLIPLTPKVETNYYGLRVTPFYSSHTIPTIGACFETTHGGANYRIIFTSDTQSLTDLKRMQRTGVIDQERYQEIADLYKKPAHLLIADGGEGAIHGDPADAAGSPAERIVFMHLDKLSERFEAQYSTATAGKRFCVLAGNTDYNLTRTIEFLLEYFPEMPPLWISHLLANQEVIRFNSGDIIIRDGTKSEGRVYMMLTGRATVVHHDGKQRLKLAEVEAGEIIGEMSIISGQGVRNASVVALSPVMITAFSEVAFREYVQQQGLEAQLKRTWHIRDIIQTLPYFRSLQPPVIRQICQEVTVERLASRNDPKPVKGISEAFSLMMPLGIELVVQRGARKETIPANASPILIQNGLTIVTEAEFQYLLLRPKPAATLRARIPAFRFFWEETLGLPIPTTVAGKAKSSIG